MVELFSQIASGFSGYDWACLGECSTVWTKQSLLNKEPVSLACSLTTTIEDVASHKVANPFSSSTHSFLTLSSFLFPLLFTVPTVEQKQDVLNQVSLSPVGSACCVVSVSADCMHILSTNIT